MTVRQYLLHIVIALDQLGTTIFGGWPDETISSYLWRLEQAGKPAGRWLRPVVDGVARAWPFRQADHCRKAYDEERTRAQLPPQLRTPKAP